MTAPCLQSGPERDYDAGQRWEVADIFRLYGPAYRKEHPLPASHLKVMRAIEACRTPELGVLVEQCDACGHVRESHPSCRNRHCPKCQGFSKACWLEHRKQELLPVGYFHLVFTLPHELNCLVMHNKNDLLSLLFEAASDTLKEFGRNPDNGLGGTLGFMAILHSWDQTLRTHIHLHCVVPGGVIADGKDRWIHASERFLFPVAALSKVFQGKFLTAVKRSHEDGAIILPENTAGLEKPGELQRLLGSLWGKEWVVYAKKPFAGPDHVLDYLSRYTHRVAISNDRIIDVEHGKVRFTYRDRRANDALKVMSLPAAEFIRRFLLHVVPTGFTRIRYYGFLANRNRKQNINLCRTLLGVALPDDSDALEKSIPERIEELTGFDPSRCPKCKRGTMVMLTDLALDASFQNRFCVAQRKRDTS